MSSEDLLLDAFGRQFVHAVRDQAITEVDLAMSGARNDIYGKYLYDRLNAYPSGSEQLVAELLPYIVDTTIRMVLFFLDEHYDTVQLLYRLQPDQDFVQLADLTDGLMGWFSGTDDWTDRFSTQRLDMITRQAFEKSREQEGEP